MATITAASASRADVLTAITAASDGDTVAVPAGSATWSTTLTITNKVITLQGAGAGQTIITSGVAGGSVMLTWTTANNGSLVTRLTGFTFNGSGVTDAFNPGVITFLGVSSNLRIDHNTLVPNGTAMFIIYEYNRGVIDHNTFNLSAASGYGMYIHHHVWNIPGSNYGDASWAAADSFGTSDAMFVEDNTFTNNQSVSLFYFANDGWLGGRVVYRNNTYTNTIWTNHGTESGGRQRSQRQHEVYNNTFAFTNGATFPAMISSRGGTGVVYNNVVTTASGAFITQVANFNHQRVSNYANGWQVWSGCGVKAVTSITSSGTTATATSTTAHGLIATVLVTILGASPAGYNGTFTVQTVPTTTTFTYTLAGALSSPATGTITHQSPWDQNSDATGYRGIDQPGIGVGDLLANFVPTPVGWPNQASDPVYVWNNTLNGVVSAASSDSNAVVENRDFFNGTPKPGYVSFTYPHPLVTGGAPPPPPIVVLPTPTPLGVNTLLPTSMRNTANALSPKSFG